MAITINSNVPSLNVLRQLGDATSKLQSSFERLSSGLRINRASDDPAGLSIASGLNVDSRVYTQAVRNGNDAVSLLSVAEGAVTELSGILVRLRELTQQSANGTFTLAQRRALDEEAASLVEEFNRIGSSTNFNTLNLLEGGSAATGIQIGYGTNGSLQLTTGDSLEHAIGTGLFTAFGNAGTISGGGVGIVSADFNGDGMLDYAHTTGDAVVHVMLGNGDGSFTESDSTVDVSDGSPITAIAAADFNGDGIQDIALTTDSGNLETFLGNGSGIYAFESQTLIDAAFLPTQIGVGDFDNNGTVDLVFASNGRAHAISGDGTGSFSNLQSFIPMSTVSFGDDIEVGDFNGDGNLDFVAITGATASTSNVFMGDGNGNFTQSTLGQSNKGGQLAVGDINNDGYDDIINSTNGGRLDVHLGSADGSFTNQLSVAVSGFASNQMNLVDGNNDGLLDIMFVSGSNILFAAGNGDGTFDYTPDQSATVGVPSAATFGDFNGDGALDVVSIDSVNVPQISLANTEQSVILPRLYLLDQEGALAAFSILDEAMERVSSEFGAIGSTMSRLSSALSTLQVTRDNLLTAESRIRDADVAQDSADLVRRQILQQSAVGVLGQANLIPQLALDLLEQP